MALMLLVAGGPLFNVAPQDFDDIDHLILNEAEITLPPFLDDLRRGCPFECDFCNVTSLFGLLNAPMGTSLYRRLHDQDRLLPYISGDNTDFSMNFVPRMEFSELLAGYRRVVTTIYTPRLYYERVRTFLEDYKPVVRSRSRVRCSDLKAFFTSVWRLGIVDRGRRYYWKLLFAGLRRPGRLPLAITMAIYGFHFRRVFGVEGTA